jgi:hypothetical protein
MRNNCAGWICWNTRGTALNYVDYFLQMRARAEPLSYSQQSRCCWFCFTWRAERKKRVRERLVGCLSVCISLVGKGRRLRVLTGSFAAANKGHACKPRPQLPPRAAPSAKALAPLSARMRCCLGTHTHNIYTPSGANVYMLARKGVQTAIMPKVRFFQSWLKSVLASAVAACQKTASRL